MKKQDVSSLDVSSLKQMVRYIKKQYQENESSTQNPNSSLKWMCKRDNIMVHTNKTKLVEAIQNHQRRINSLMKIQSCIRGFLVRLFWKGYRRTTKRSCVNETDFYTLEPIEEIPVELYYVYKSCHVQYGFNVCSLMIYYHKNRFNSKTLLNPYNREEIKIKPIQQMIRFMRFYFPKTYHELENNDFFKTFMKITFTPLHSVSLSLSNTSRQADNHTIQVGAGRDYQGAHAIAIGGRAGTNQQANHAIAIRGIAGTNQQDSHAIAIGSGAGVNQQDSHAIAVGSGSGTNHVMIPNNFFPDFMDQRFTTEQTEFSIVYNAPILTEPLHMELLQNLTELSSLPVHRRIQELFIDFDLFGNYTNSLWFSTLSIRGYKIFFMKVRELWNHLPGVVQQSICCIGDPFYLVNIGDINRIRSLLDMKMACIRLMEYMTHGGVSREDQKIGVYQLLIALTHVSREARQALQHLL